MIIVFLLCLSLSSAITLQEARLTTLNGRDIEYIHPSEQVVVNLIVTLEDINDVNKITVDYTDLNPSAPESDYVETTDILDCITSKTRAVCLFSNIVFQTPNTLATINITAERVDGTKTSFTHAFSFVIDETAPEVAFIGPETCFDGNCYVSSGHNKVLIELQDNPGAFNRQHIAFNYGPTVNLVHKCEGMSCFGYGNAPCNDGGTVPISIGVGPFGPSSDDAGNPVKATTTTVRCDAKAPELPESIEEYDVTLASGIDPVYPEKDGVYVRIGETVTLTFDVIERISPTLEVTIDTSALSSDQGVIDGVCEDAEGDGVWSCTLNFDITAGQPMEGVRLPIIAKDLVGNVEKRFFELSVLGVDEGPADDWVIGSVPQQMANKHYLKFTPKRVFIDLSLTKKSSTALLLDVKPRGTCKAVTNERNGGVVSYGTDADLTLEVISFSGSTVLLQGELSAGLDGHYEELSRAEYECTIDLQTIRGDYVVLQPENETFTVKFSLYDSPTLGEMVTDEIEAKKNKSLRTISLVSSVQKGLSIAQTVCTFGPTLKTAGSALNAVGVALHYATPTLKTVGDAAHDSGKGLQNTAESITDITKGVCKVLQCDMGYMDGVLSNINFMESAGFDSKKLLNPYDSWLSSLVTLCVPAAIQHMDSYAGIECDYLACLSRDIPAGTATLEMCNQRKGYASCMWFSRGLYNGIPFFSMFRDIIGNVLDVVKDPVSLFGSVGIILPCKLSSWLTGGVLDSIVTKTCYMTKGVTGAVEAYTQINQLTQQLGRMFSKGHTGAEGCSEVTRYIDKKTTYWDYGATSSEFLNPDKVFAVYDEKGELVDVDATTENYEDLVEKNRFSVASPFTGLTTRIYEPNAQGDPDYTKPHDVTVFALEDKTEYYFDGEKVNVNKGGDGYSVDKNTGLNIVNEKFIKKTIIKRKKEEDAAVKAFEDARKKIESLLVVPTDDNDELAKTEEDFNKKLAIGIDSNTLKYELEKLESIGGDNYAKANKLVDSYTSAHNKVQDFKLISDDDVKESLESSKGGLILPKEGGDLQITTGADGKPSVFLPGVIPPDILKSPENMAKQYMKDVVYPVIYGEDGSDSRSEFMKLYGDWYDDHVHFEAQNEEMRKQAAEAEGNMEVLKSYDENNKYLEENGKFNDGVSDLTAQYQNMLLRAKGNSEKLAKIEKDITAVFGEGAVENGDLDSVVVKNAITGTGASLNKESVASGKSRRLQEKALGLSKDYSNAKKGVEDAKAYVAKEIIKKDIVADKDIADNPAEYSDTKGNVITPDNDNTLSYNTLSSAKKEALSRRVSEEKINEALEDTDDYVAKEREKMNDAKKIIRDNDRDEARNQAAVKVQDYIDKNWKGGSAIASSYQAIQSANLITNSLANQDVLKIGWSKDGDSNFDNKLAAVSDWVEQGLETASCQKKLGSDSSSAIILNEGGEKSLYTTAAYVAALRKFEGALNNKNQYSYVIHVYVDNQREIDENLSFSVVLKGAGTPVTVPLEYDENDQLITTYDLAYKKSFKHIKGDMLSYPYVVDQTTTNKFTEVCIVFHNNNLRRWFSVIRNDQSEFCVEVESG